MITRLSTPRSFAILGGLLFIYGAKCWLIARFGSDTPFWDQWNAEADALFRPYLGGTLRFSALFEQYNEHRIFLNRVVALALLQVNGHWSPLLQMLMNGVVHVLAIAIFILAIRKLLSTGMLIAFMLFATATMSMPFGWENTLGSVNLQFYLLVALSLASLSLLYDAPPWSVPWFAGVAFGIVGYFAMASAALTFIAVIIAMLLQRAVGYRKDASNWTALAGLAGISIIMVLDVPKDATDAARSFAQAFAGLVKLASWPLAAHHWTLAMETAGALIVQAPLAVLTWRTLRCRLPVTDPRWFLVTTGIWVALQIAALGYGRSGMMAPRYFDIFMPGILINAACVLVLWNELQETYGRNLLVRPLLAMWIFAILYGGGQKATTYLPIGLAFREQTEKIQTENLKAFLATGDAAHLRDKPLFHIPYPSAEALAAISSDPLIRAILPPHLVGMDQAAPLRDIIIKNGPMLMPIGLGFLMIAILGMARRDPETEASRI